MTVIRGDNHGAIYRPISQLLQRAKVLTAAPDNFPMKTETGLVNEDLRSLLAELTAIDAFDREYLDNHVRSTLELVAFRARQDRRRQILNQLLDEGVEDHRTSVAMAFNGHA